MACVSGLRTKLTTLLVLSGVQRGFGPVMPGLRPHFVDETDLDACLHERADTEWPSGACCEMIWKSCAWHIWQLLFILERLSPSPWSDCTPRRPLLMG